MTKVVRAEHAGACYGVQRAVDMALEEAGRNGDVATLGPLIHNPQVVHELETMGVGVVEDARGVGKGDTVIIRSHGVGPSAKAALEATGARISDATCPHVYRAQKAASDLAREIGYVVVVGDPDHPEVEAIREYAELQGGTVIVADGPGGLPASLPASVGVVVQTTQNRKVFESVLSAVRSRVENVVVRDTICSATAKRQKSAADLAQDVDAMVVIGGHNSSNTTRLYEICKEICDKTYHVETVEELKDADLPTDGVIGVTAGASTPEYQIASIVEYLERL